MGLALTNQKKKNGFSFSRRSERKLAFAHSDLQRLAREAIKVVDFSVLWTWRSDDLQEDLFDLGLTKKKGGKSKHNKKPSDAMDLAPFPIDWVDRERFCYFAGILKGIAAQMEIKIRWGGDWDQDNKTLDETFSDMCHFELM